MGILIDGKRKWQRGCLGRAVKNSGRRPWNSPTTQWKRGNEEPKEQMGVESNKEALGPFYRVGR
jgi:hypothetical protein